MKKAVLEKRIAMLAKANNVEWLPVGGTKHDKFTFNGIAIMIPRHREIGEMLAMKILKDCQKALGLWPMNDDWTSTLNTYAVTVRRDGRFWYIEIPALDGATQARSLSEVEEMTRDYIASFMKVSDDSFELNISVELPAAVQEHVAAVELARRAEAVARSKAATEWSAAARELRNQGLTVRDIGLALHVSHQRAQQLISQ